MKINPKEMSVEYAIGAIKSVETALDEIEQKILTDNGVSSSSARIIAIELNNIRDSLYLKRGVQRHDKFKPES